VARKQKLAARLRREITELEGDISDLKTRLSDLESSNRRRGIYSSHEEGCKKREIKREEERLEEKREELTAAERAPPAVFQPMPESDQLARRAIFMLTMPERLQVLARLSVMAQQMLLPDDPKV
jgi:DNA repair exonuclease SbcCD ATPase subunit